MKTSTSTRLSVSLLILMFFFFAVAAASAQVTPSDDTYTLTTAPATNYGTNGGLQLTSAKATVFVRFDLGSIPAGYTNADIAKATLKLYVNSVATPGSFNVNYVVGPWSEMTVNATVEPAIGAAIASGVSVTTANKGDYILIDVTSALGAWLDGSQANDGIALVANSPLNVIFSSKENTVASHSPELDIVFTGTGPRGPQGFAGTTGPAGAQGPIGPTGATGTQGPVGKTGAVGTKGPVGPAGPQGATGATGTPGPVGATGAQGSVGLTGAQGPQGAQGAAGTNGTGFNFRNGFDPTPQYAVNDVVTWNGSTYVAIAANGGPNNLMPDTNPSAWTLMARQGVAGATGSQGPAGAVGSQGAIGPQGSTGGTGATGPQGPIGLTGAQGVQGAAGTNGTGFNFRGAFNASTAYAINDVVTYAPANITYNVNLAFGSGGSMVGTITTDGTIGVLSTSNIISWNLRLADSPTNSTLLTPSNSAFSSGNHDTGGQPNSDFSATSTNLTFTYASGGSWGVSGASGQFCMTDWSNCFGPVAYGTWSINGDNLSTFSGASGTQVIGTGGTVATPIASTYVATAPVAAGAAIPGTIPWAMMAQAGATGAASTVAGPAGPQGPAGAVGLTGATGATGPQGAVGATGVQGPIGLTGASGAQGPAGMAGPQGATGATGAQGPIGLTGAQGAPGSNGTGFNWKGSWNAATSYNVNDVATFNGTSYIATQSNINNEPDLSVGSSNDNITVTFTCNSVVPNNGMFLDCSSVPGAVVGGMNSLTYSVPSNPQNSPNNGESFFLTASGFINGTPVNLDLTYNDMTVDPWNGSLAIYMLPGQGQFVPVVLVGAGCQYNQYPYSCTSASSFWTGTVTNATLETGNISAISDANFGVTGSSPVTYVVQPTNSWNIMALSGAAGAQGATGPQGPIGLTGATGAAGAQGSVGANGAVGATGPQGATGATGTPGLIGLTGAQGIQGIQGATGPQGAIGPQGPAGNTPGHIALLQWWSSLTYSVGTGPAAVAFDGTNVWVTNQSSGSVTKLLASTGALVGTYPVGTYPAGVAFDGTNIWVANNGSNSVTKLLASTGALVGTYPVGGNPSAVAFDGTNIWVTNCGDGPSGTTVTELLASTGAQVNTLSGFSSPHGVAFDGTNIWVTNYFGNSVTKLLASTGAVVGTYSVGTTPNYLVFDGTNIWVANQGDTTVTKLLASTGAVVGTYSVGSGPVGMAFDGTDIWVVSNGNSVTKLLASTGAVVGNYSVGSGGGMAFDGANIWVANGGGNTVSKIPAF